MGCSLTGEAMGDSLVLVAASCQLHVCALWATMQQIHILVVCSMLEHACMMPIWAGWLPANSLHWQQLRHIRCRLCQLLVLANRPAGVHVHARGCYVRLLPWAGSRLQGHTAHAHGVLFASCTSM